MDPPTLLFIDDCPQMLKLRKAALESNGYYVKVASSGYTAIRTLEKTSVAAVLLEYKQEGMHAEAIAYHIKQSPQFADHSAFRLFRDAGADPVVGG